MTTSLAWTIDFTSGDNVNHEIIPFKGHGGRWVIKFEDGRIENAQGYGYKSRDAAHRAAWYHAGGKEAIKSNNSEAKQFIKVVKEQLGVDLEKVFDDELDLSVKEIMRGEITMEHVYAYVESKAQRPLPKSVRKYLENKK